MTRRRETPAGRDTARHTTPPTVARDVNHQLPSILEYDESLTINLVITCENRRKEIANLSSWEDNGSFRGMF